MLITFGELLMRLSAPDHQRLRQAAQFDIQYGGAEANVAAALTQMGGRAKYVTRLPENGIGDAAVGALQSYGVDCSHVVRGGDRIGIYFLEKGASYRPSQVVYDRKNSAIAASTPDMFDWDAILAGADSFFFTGITAAVTDPAILTEALAACRTRGIRTYCDVNYRAALWTAEEAGSVMAPMMTQVDVLVVNEEHARLLFGVVPPDDENEEVRFAAIARDLVEKFGCSKVVLTCRESISSDDNEIWAWLYDGAALHCSSRYKMHIVDRVGGGDALSAALIYTESPDIPAKILSADNPAAQIDFACAANALKHSIEGDIYVGSAAEIARVMEAAQSGGRIRLIR